MFDVAVIGRGPAAVSAAVTLKIREKDILLIGEKPSEKVAKAHKIKNYPGLFDISGQELSDAFEEHLKRLDIKPVSDSIVTVYAMGNSFSLQAKSGEVYSAKSVIVATGVVNEKSIDGEKELLGRGVSYCVTCDAQLHKGKAVAVMAYNDVPEDETELLKKLCTEVYFLPMGNVSVPQGVTVINDKPLKIVSKDLFNRTLITEGGQFDISCVFIEKDAIAPTALIPGIETDGRHILTDRKMATNIPGLFACGDVAGKPYQYVKAAGEGNVAALSAVEYISGMNSN